MRPQGHLCRWMRVPWTTLMVWTKIKVTDAIWGLNESPGRVVGGIISWLGLVYSLLSSLKTALKILKREHYSSTIPSPQLFFMILFLIRKLRQCSSYKSLVFLDTSDVTYCILEWTIFISLNLLSFFKFQICADIHTVVRGTSKFLSFFLILVIKCC
jgi:hypothetical protein